MPPTSDTRPHRPPVIRGLLLAVLCPLAALTPARAQQIDTMELRAHSYYLSHDALEGRGTGTRGERIAARYLESQLRLLGLGPAGTDGYLQQVPLGRARVDPAGATLEVASRGGETHRFAYGRDFLVAHGGPDAYRDFEGELLFVGTGAIAATLPDLAVAGRVVALFGPLGAEDAQLVDRWAAAGAAAVLSLVPDVAIFGRERSRLERPRHLLRTQVDAPVWQPALPVLIAGAAPTAALLADAGPARPPDRADFRPIVPGHRVRARTPTNIEPLPAANVAGVLIGSDPERRDEFVAYTAHYDHLGIVAGARDSIYNGFSDNAAGVAMLLAIADALATAPPARSVLFLFFTAEEHGLLGSSWYAHRPTVPLGAIAGVVNLDGGAPPAPPAEWRVAGGTASTLGERARAIGARHGWSVHLSEPRANSDYWPFAHRGVPAVFLIPGDAWEGVDAGGRARLLARWERYHQPGDEWSLDFPFAGLERYARLALELGLEVANASGRPRLETGGGRRR